eukprot:1371502-Rhodomonas_salina.3
MTITELRLPSWSSYGSVEGSNAHTRAVFLPRRPCHARCCVVVAAANEADAALLHAERVEEWW